MRFVISFGGRVFLTSDGGMATRVTDAYIYTSRHNAKHAIDQLKKTADYQLLKEKPEITICKIA